MRKTKTLHVNKKTKDQIKFISNCLNQTMNAFMAELMDEIFKIFSTYLPKDASARIFYDSVGNKLIVTSGGKSYTNSGCIPNAPNNLTDSEMDNLVRQKLGETLRE